MKCKCKDCKEMRDYLVAYSKDRDAPPPPQKCADALIAHSKSPELKVVPNAERD